MSDLVLVSEPTEAGAVTLTLNRPDKRNALSTELRDMFSDALDELAGDKRVKVAIVTGAGEVFSAGFDLKEFQVEDPAFQERLWASSHRFHKVALEFPLPLIAAVNGPALAGGFDLDEFEVAVSDAAFGKRLWASSDEWHRRWIEFPVPTIAAVNGPAIAGGFDVAVMCDLRVVADTATFAHPEVTFGDVVYGPLHDLVGGAVARDLCFTGRRIDATEADRLGLATRLVPAGEVVDRALELATGIAGAPRATLVRLKAKAVRRAATVQGGTLDL